MNKKNWIHLLVLQSGNPDKMESLEIDVLFEIENLAESCLRAVEPGLSKSLHEWDLDEVPFERNLSPDETCYKKMFEASSRTWSDYSHKPILISSILVVLSLTTVELDHRICCEDSKRKIKQM